MNVSQRKVKEFMDTQITEMESGLDNLRENECQPTEIGDIYNGMLKHCVSFEIKHMKKLKDALIEALA